MFWPLIGYQPAEHHVRRTSSVFPAYWLQAEVNTAITEMKDEVDGEDDAVLPPSNARQAEEENFPSHPPMAIRSGPSHKIYRIERWNFPTTRVGRQSVV